jgi:hypothetical protein
MNLPIHGLVAILGLSVMPAIAAPSGTVFDQRIVITAPAAKVTPLSGTALMQSLAGGSHFAMSDGERLQLIPRGSQLRMRYAGRAPVTLRPDGDGGYVSQDRRFALVASTSDDGDTHVRLTRPRFLD